MSNTSIEKLPYRPCVGCCVVNRQGEVFVGQRIDSKDPAWQMPQGGIDNNESPLEAALREVYEETGITKLEFIYESDKWYYYDLPEKWQATFFGGKFKGQKQKWFLFRFIGDDNEVILNRMEPEFLGWKWVRFDDLPGLAADFKRHIYQEISEEFRQLLRP